MRFSSLDLGTCCRRAHRAAPCEDRNPAVAGRPSATPGRRAERPAACGSCGRPCAPRTRARRVRWAWAGRRAGWSTRPATFRRSAKNRCRRWSPTCRGRSSPISSARIPSRSSQAFSPRELEACGRLTQPLLHRAGENYYRPISWDDALSRIVEKLKSVAPNETLWYFSGRSSQRGRVSVAALRSAVWHEQRQQLQLLLPPGQRRGAAPARSAPARARCSLTTSSMPTWCFSSAATRPATIRG